MRKVLLAVAICVVLTAFLFNGKYTVEKSVYLDDNVRIEYPHVGGHSANIDKINDTIKNYAVNNAFVKEYLANDSRSEDRSYLKMSYQTDFMNDDVLSIIMTGTYNISTCAHPLNIYLTLNIDMRDGAVLRYTDMYSTKDTVSEVRKYAEDQLSKPVYETIFADAGNIETHMEEVDRFDNGVCYSAYSKDFCVLSFAVPHSLGDHVEVKIPLSALGER